MENVILIQKRVLLIIHILVYKTVLITTMKLLENVHHVLLDAHAHIVHPKVLINNA